MLRSKPRGDGVPNGKVRKCFKQEKMVAHVKYHSVTWYNREVTTCIWQCGDPSEKVRMGAYLEWSGARKWTQGQIHLQKLGHQGRVL